MLALLASLLLPIAIGHAVVSRLWSMPRRGGGALAHAGLAIGIGMGCTSLLVFAVALCIGLDRGTYLAVDVAALVIAGVLCWRRRDRRLGDGDVVGSGDERSDVGAGATWTAFAFVVLVAAVVFVLRTLGAPHGDGDAVGIWNMRAIFLHRGGGLAPEAFAPALAHGSYPLSVPLSALRGWLFAGRETPLSGVVVGAVYEAAVVALLVGAAWLRAGTHAAIAACVVLLGSALLLRHGATQTADVPLAFCVLATCVAATSRRLALAGLAAGLAAWTKNEGLLFVLVATVCCAWPLRAIGAWIGGVGVPMLAVGWFKLLHAPPTDLIANRDLGSPLTERILDPERHVTVASAFGRQLLWFDGHNGAGGPGMLAWLIVALVLGRIVRPLPMRAVAALGAMTAGYYAVFVATPQPLDWHLRTALGRVLLHVYPAFAFVLVTSFAWRAAVRDDVSAAPGRTE